MTAQVAIGPFQGARIALTVTNLLGDVKGEYWSDSATAIMDKAADLAQWPDTVVWVYDTTLDGEPVGQPFARIGRTDDSPYSPKWVSL